MQFFIAPVASWLRTRRFSEPTFRPSGATNHWKNTVFRNFPTFSRICIFFLPDSFSSDLLSSNLPLLSASALLCFSSVHIVGSLTSKLPSINYMHVLDMILKVIEMPKKNDTSQYALIPVPVKLWPVVVLWFLPGKGTTEESFCVWLLLVQDVFMRSHLLRQVFKLLFQACLVCLQFAQWSVWFCLSVLVLFSLHLAESHCSGNSVSAKMDSARTFANESSNSASDPDWAGQLDSSLNPFGLQHCYFLMSLKHGNDEARWEILFCLLSAGTLF